MITLPLETTEHMQPGGEVKRLSNVMKTALNSSFPNG